MGAGAEGTRLRVSLIARPKVVIIERRAVEIIELYMREDEKEVLVGTLSPEGYQKYVGYPPPALGSPEFIWLDESEYRDVEAVIRNQGQQT